MKINIDTFNENSLQYRQQGDSSHEEKQHSYDDGNDGHAHDDACFF